jgi:hypothetical protein
MTPRVPVDANGHKVITFAANVRTLGKLGELAEQITTMAESGAWRQYRTAVGTDHWRACEFDYFLIACDLEYDDVYRAIKWHRLGEATRSMMDQNAQPAKRRPLEQAAAAYHAAGPETLMQKAERLHWIGKSGKPRSPLSDRQRAQQASGGKTLEAQARSRREEKISLQRRHKLDQLALKTFAGLNEDERRYLVDVMAKLLTRSAGRPKGDQAQWVRDIIKLNSNPKALAEYWSVPYRTAQSRIKNTRINNPGVEVLANEIRRHAARAGGDGGRRPEPHHRTP